MKGIRGPCFGEKTGEEGWTGGHPQEAWYHRAGRALQVTEHTWTRGPVLGLTAGCPGATCPPREHEARGLCKALPARHRGLTALHPQWEYINYKQINKNNKDFP